MARPHKDHQRAQGQARYAELQPATAWGAAPGDSPRTLTRNTSKLVLLPGTREKPVRASGRKPEARLIPTPKFEGEQARPGCWDEMTYTECNCGPMELPKHYVRTPQHYDGLGILATNCWDANRQKQKRRYHECQGQE
jgi:hypothetical protein